jgi:fatty-acyl-CoA synthase
LRLAPAVFSIDDAGLKYQDEPSGSYVNQRFVRGRKFGMLAGIKSEFAYVAGLMRVVKATRPITANPSRTLGDHLDDWTQRYGDKVALESATEKLSYREIGQRANAYARWALAQGFAKGEAVALMMPNRPEYVAIWMGLARVGVATALINTNLTGQALAHSLKAVHARAVIVDAEYQEVVAAAQTDFPAGTAVWAYGEGGGAARLDLERARLSGAPLAASERRALDINEIALYVYTSGTTGLPKAARITHSRALRAMYAFGAAIGASESDRAYMCLPMYHTNGGIIGPGLVLPFGGSGFIRERFSASAFWTEAAERGCTTFVYIGELCRYLLNTPEGPADRAHKIRACTGNGLRPDIFSAFQSRFGIARVLEFYAATEGNAAMINFDSRPGAIGRIPKWAASRFPVAVVAFNYETTMVTRGPDGRCRICGPDETGELIAEIRNDPKLPAARFDGYADEHATQQKVLHDVFKPGDSWFRTGDLVRRDEKNYFYFVDRIGDTFRWKGENVSTTEVAEALQQFHGVQEAVVYGVSVPGHDGRAGMAALVVDSVAGFDIKGLRAHIAARLPAYARPLFLRFRSHLDVTGTFKQRKGDLVKEGFDPARSTDPVYFDDRASDGYERVSETLISALGSGRIRF